MNAADPSTSAASPEVTATAYPFGIAETRVWGSKSVRCFKTAHGAWLWAGLYLLCLAIIAAWCVMKLFQQSPPIALLPWILGPCLLYSFGKTQTGLDAESSSTQGSPTNGSQIVFHIGRPLSFLAMVIFAAALVITTRDFFSKYG